MIFFDRCDRLILVMVVMNVNLVIMLWVVVLLSEFFVGWLSLSLFVMSVGLSLSVELVSVFLLYGEMFV